MIEAEWWEYDSQGELAEAVAGDVGFIVESAVDARNASLIALPGGEDVAPIYARLAKQSLQWKRVTIIPTDDRLVPVESELANVREIARAFLPTGARVIPIASGTADDYRLAGNAADARLQDLSWPPDLVWLGVGEDGHTASIFTGPDLKEALDAPKARRAIGVMPDPLPADAPVARVTLTRPAILSARTILITVTGDAKRELLEQAIADGHSSRLPIGRVLAEVEQPIDIHWCP
jgi:6-phosphogluconolactonase